jgi:phosphoenolpyruvate synthase/pyruvate phosphate dikinase
MSRWVLTPAEALDSPHAGGKARALARAVRAGLPVPEWCVVSSDAFAAAGEGSTIAPEVLAEIEAAVRSLGPRGDAVAVRTSPSD